MKLYSYLDDLNPFDLLDQEALRCLAFYESLSDDDPAWARGTRCAGWNVRDMLSHFDGVEVYHLACLNDTIPAVFEEAGKDGVNDVHSFNDWIIRKRADLDARTVLDSWRVANAEVRERFRALGPDGTMSTMVGPYPSGLQAFHVASEYATHADDIDILISAEERAARLNWRVDVSRFGLEETGREITVDSVGGEHTITWEGDTVTLSDFDFVEAVCGRLPADYPIDPAFRQTLIGLA